MYSNKWNTRAGTAYVYKCKDCTLKIRVVELRGFDGRLFRVDLHKSDNSHTHEISADDDCASRGIPQHFKEVIHRLEANLVEVGGTRRAVTATEALNAIRKQYGADKRYKDMLMSSNSDVIRHKIKRYMDYEKSKGMMARIHSVSDIVAYVRGTELELPHGYAPSSAYTNPESLAAALGCEIDHTISLSIPDNDFGRALVKKYLSDDNGDSIFQTIVSVTPATLFTMLDQVRNFPSGARLIQIDGIANVTNDGKKVLVVGCHDIGFRRDLSRVTTSLHPFSYVLCPGEREVCVGFTLDLLRYYFQLLFGIELEFDWGGCDHSSPIASGLRMGAGGSGIFILLCWFHAIKIIRDRRQEYLFGKISILDKALKNKFQQDMLLIFSKLHRCRSRAQVETVFQLTLGFCRELSQDAYASHISKTFSGEWLNFYFSASGHPGVTPTGSPTESHNRLLKGGKNTDGLLTMNVSTTAFLQNDLPHILSHASYYLSGAKLLPHSNPSKWDEAAAALMDAEIDIHKIAEERWVVNSPWATLAPITQQRIQTYNRAVAGENVAPKEMVTLDSINLNVNSTEQFCFVTRKRDGTFIGNCKSCYMHLSCPACILVKEHLHELQPPLSSRLKKATPTTRKAGRPLQKGLGGLGGRQISFDTSSLDQTKQEFVATLADEPLRKLCRLLRVRTHEQRPPGSNKKKKRVPRNKLLTGIISKLGRNKARAVSEDNDAEMSDEESDDEVEEEEQSEEETGDDKKIGPASPKRLRRTCKSIFRR